MRKAAYNLCKALVILGIAGAGAALAAGPAGLSQKPGLWQLQQSMARMPRPVVTRICVDASMTDRLVDASQHMKGVSCSKRDIRLRPGGATVDSVCSMSGRTISTHAEINQPSPNAFHETVSSTMTPAIAGHGSSNSAIDGAWQGACPAGMKAGDMIVNGMKMNMYDMTAAVAHHP